jgi:hypothetical protein
LALGRISIGLEPHLSGITAMEWIIKSLPCWSDRFREYISEYLLLNDDLFLD